MINLESKRSKTIVAAALWTVLIGGAYCHSREAKAVEVVEVIVPHISESPSVHSPVSTTDETPVISESPDKTVIVPTTTPSTVKQVSQQIQAIDQRDQKESHEMLSDIMIGVLAVIIAIIVGIVIF